MFTVETKDLATKSLYIQSKKFYIDVKENRRGRFIKMSEVIFTNFLSVSINYILSNSAVSSEVSGVKFPEIFLLSFHKYLTIIDL